MGCGQSHDAQPVGVGHAAPVGKPASSSSSSSSSPIVEGKSTANGSSALSAQAAAAQKAGAPPRFGPPVPVSVLTDSYKASHFLMYPDAKLMVAYGQLHQRHT